MAAPGNLLQEPALLVKDETLKVSLRALATVN